MVIDTEATLARTYVHVSSGSIYDTASEEVCVGSSSSDPNKAGHMNKFERPVDGKASKEEA